MDKNALNKSPQSLYTRIVPDKQTADRVLPVSSIRQIPQITDKTIQEEGKREEMINEAAKIEEDKHMVSDLIKKSNRCIISASTHFPWTLFPNTIEVEESKVTSVFRQLFASQSHSVDIKDISNVFIESSPFFATLQIVSRTFAENDITIGHLNAKEAYRVQMIIEGLRTFAANNIDTCNYEIKELIAKIEEFHKDKTITKGGEKT
jgi:hypothetical protein